MRLPFAHLNLRKNPFGQFSIEERTQLVEVNVDNWATKLANPRYCVQFVGEKGYGKTTHLLALKAMFPDAGYVHIAEGEFAPVPAGSPIIIDEAQRLTKWQQFRTFRARVPLVLGTHFDYTKHLRFAGRTFDTVEVAQFMSSARLVRILNRRIEWVRRGNGPVPQISKSACSILLKEYGPDIRSIQRKLYDTFQEMTEVQDVEV